MISDYDSQVLINNLVTLVIIYLIVRIIIKVVKGGFKKDLQETKQSLYRLEKDYVWRRVKLIYLILATIVTLLFASFAYNNAVNEPPYEPSLGAGFTVFIVGIIIVFIIYKFVLPKLYTYLKKPSA